MKVDKIKSLLEKYYAGESSLEEEEQLIIALKSMDQLPEDLLADAELFAMMNALSTDSSESNIDLPIEDTKVVQIASKSHDFNLSWTMRVAAGFAILVFRSLTSYFSLSSLLYSKRCLNLDKSCDPTVP